MNYRICGDWELELDGTKIAIDLPAIIRVEDEKHDALPLYQAQTVCGWAAGVRLTALIAAECTLAGALLPETVEVSTADGKTLARGVDYELDDAWASLGRLEGGTETPILVSYSYIPTRLDAVMRDCADGLRYVPGIPAVSCPAAPEPGPGETRVLNLLIDRSTRKLTPDTLYPVLETAAPSEDASCERRFIPRAMEKLQSGAPLRILCWGDSVTVGAYLENPADRWPCLFLEKLRRKYPEADIDLMIHGWGGRSVGSYLAEPPGSPHNFAEKILASGADLIISEFVNDALLSPEVWRETFGPVLAAFRERNIEWIILTPHYVRPDWMGLTGQNGKEIEEDPRPYVHFLRTFSAGNKIALADAARRYGRLYRQGIPYNTLMTNNINHPNRRGMMVFAEALDAIF